MGEAVETPPLFVCVCAYFHVIFNYKEEMSDERLG